MTREEIADAAVRAGLLLSHDASAMTPSWSAPTPGPDYVERLVEFAALVEQAAAVKEREACIRALEGHQIPVGNSPAGEMACEWTMGALRDIRDAIRARGEKR